MKINVKGQEEKVIKLKVGKCYLIKYNNNEINILVGVQKDIEELGIRIYDKGTIYSRLSYYQESIDDGDIEIIKEITEVTV